MTSPANPTLTPRLRAALEAVPDEWTQFWTHEWADIRDLQRAGLVEVRGAAIPESVRRTALGRTALENRP